MWHAGPLVGKPGSAQRLIALRCPTRPLEGVPDSCARWCVLDWPSWRPDVTGAQLTGPFAVGSSFHWQTAGLDITSQISQVIAGSRTTWGGPASSIDGVHIWEFTPHGRGVLVRTTESWNGAPVRAAVAALQSALDESLRVWLRDLRDEAARRGSPSRT